LKLKKRNAQSIPFYVFIISTGHEVIILGPLVHQKWIVAQYWLVKLIFVPFSFELAFQSRL